MFCSLRNDTKKTILARAYTNKEKLFRDTCVLPRNNNSPKIYNFPHETAFVILTAPQPSREKPAFQQSLSKGRYQMLWHVALAGIGPSYVTNLVPIISEELNGLEESR